MKKNSKCIIKRIKNMKRDFKYAQKKFEKIKNQENFINTKYKEDIEKIELQFQKVENSLRKIQKESIIILTKNVILMIIFSIITSLLLFSIFLSNINYDFINSDFNHLKIINIYILLLGLFMTVLNLFKDDILNKNNKDFLFSLNKINFYTIFLIPLYFLAIVSKKNKLIYTTLFILIAICFYFLISIISLLYASFKIKIEKIGAGD